MWSVLLRGSSKSLDGYDRGSWAGSSQQMMREPAWPYASLQDRTLNLRTRAVLEADFEADFALGLYHRRDASR